MQILNIYFRYTGRLFRGCAFLLLIVILSELHEKSRRNEDWVTEKSRSKNLCEWHYFFDRTLSFLCHFLLLSSSAPLPKWCTCWIVPIKIHNIAMDGILRDVEYENLLLFNASWLASLRTWCYFRLFLASIVLAMTLC